MPRSHTLLMRSRGRQRLQASMWGLALVAGLFILEGNAQVQRGPLRFEDLLPADCYLVISCQGLEKAGGKVEAQALYRIFEEPEVREFLEPAISAFTEKLDEARHAEAAPGLPLARIWEFFGGRLGIALGGMTSIDFMPVPAAIAGLEVGEKLRDVEAFLEGLLDRLPLKTRETMLRGSFDYRGVHVKTVGSTEGQWEVSYTSLQNLLVVSTCRYYLVDCLTNYLAAGRPDAVKNRLVERASFRRARSKIGESEPILWAHLNIESFKERFGFIPPLNRLCGLLGISNINSLTLASHLEGNGSRELAYLDAPGERNGLLWLVEPGPIDRQEVGWAPPNAFVYAAIPCRLSEGYTAAAESLKQGLLGLLPPHLHKQVEQMLQQFFLWVPANVLGDLLEPLGDTLSTYLAFSSSLMPDIVASVRIENPWRFETALARLMTVLPAGTLQTTKYLDETIYYTNVSGNSFRAQPAFVVQGDRLIAASQVMVLKKTMQWARDPAQPKLAAAKDFQTCVASLRGAPGPMVYLNLPLFFAGAYGQLAPGLPSRIQQERLPFDPDSVPAVETIVRHLRGIVTSYSADDGGLLFEMAGPMGIGALLECAGALGHWIFDQGYGDALVSLAQSEGARAGRGPGGAVGGGMMPSVGPSTRGGLAPGVVTAPAVQVPSASALRMRKLASYEGQHVDVRSDLEAASVSPLLSEADDAFAKTCALLGVSERRGGGWKPTIVITKDREVYNSFGVEVQDDDDATMSSVLPVFCAMEKETSSVWAYVLRDVNDDYTRLMTRHGAAELAIRTLAGSESLPRWFLEGVACYVSRYHRPDLAAWSVDGLMNEGGPIDLDTFFHPFTMSRQNVLQAGLLVAFIADGRPTRELRFAWRDVLGALADRGAGAAEMVAKLEPLIVANAAELDAYVEGLPGGP
ncbi:MAG: hypothetical protein AB1486_14590 [Planctomycetota bacterium]